MKKGLHIIRSLFSEIKYPNILSDKNNHCFALRSDEEIDEYPCLCYLQLKCINCGCLYGIYSEKATKEQYMLYKQYVYDVYIPKFFIKSVSSYIDIIDNDKHRNMKCKDMIIRDIIE